MLHACDDKNRKGSTLKETCYSKELQNIALKNDHQIAFQTLETLQERDAKSRGCHFIAHGIGYGAYQRDKSNWQKSIREINRMCGYGAIHGVIEKYIADLPQGEFSDILSDICRVQYAPDCNHIVGHLVLVEKQGNIDSALELCSAFQDERQLFHCLTGVFMEQVTALNLIDHGYAPRAYLNWQDRMEELETLCRLYDGEKAAACWKEIVHAAVVKFYHDPQDTFQFCSTAQTEQAAEKCVSHAIGIIAAAKNYELDSLKEMCKIEQPNNPLFEDKCYRSLASALINSVPREVTKGIDFCLSLDTTFQQNCLTAIGNFFRSTSTFTKKEKRKLCERAPTTSLINSCMGEL